MLRLTVDQSAECLNGFGSDTAGPGRLVAARFRRSGYSLLWGVSCQFSQGVLLLLGTVPTFHLKQMAQELAMRTPGIAQVRNDLHVPDSGV